MKYSNEVIEARKVYDGLLIERRELAKELAEIKAEIEDKLAGKPTARKFEVLKKRQAEVEARLADMPGLIADARDALVVALNADAEEKKKRGKEIVLQAVDSLGPEITEYKKIIDAIEKKVSAAVNELAQVTGESFSINIEWLITEAAKHYMDDANLDHCQRIKKRLDARMMERVFAAISHEKSEADNLRRGAVR